MKNDIFISGRYDTSFIEKHYKIKRDDNGISQDLQYTGTTSG